MPTLSFRNGIPYILAITFCTFIKIVMVMSRVFVISCFFLLPVISFSQTSAALSSSLIRLPNEAGLFESDEVIGIRLSGNVKAVLNDRGDVPQYHPLKLSYYTKDSNEVIMDVNVKT